MSEPTYLELEYPHRRFLAISAAAAAEAIAFTEMILRLGQTPRDQLRAYTL